MARQKWFYYLHKEGNAIAKVNMDAFEWRMEQIGFLPCTHVEWLKKRRELNAEREIDIEGKVEGRSIADEAMSHHWEED